MHFEMQEIRFFVADMLRITLQHEHNFYEQQTKKEMSRHACFTVLLYLCLQKYFNE